MSILKIIVESYELKHPIHPYGYGIYRGGWTVGNLMPFYNEIKVYGTIRYSDNSTDSGVELLEPKYITLEASIDVEEPNISMEVTNISNNKIHGVVIDSNFNNLPKFKTGLEALTSEEIDRLFPPITTTATYILKVKPDPKVTGLVVYKEEMSIHVLRFGESVASAMWMGYFNKLKELKSKPNLTDDDKLLLDSIYYTDKETGFILTPSTPRWVLLKFIEEKYGRSSPLFLDRIKKFNKK